MILLVSLAAAKTHLRVLSTDHDYDIELKIGMASDIVLDYIKNRTVPTEWIIGTSPITYDIPALIQAAVLLVVGELYFSREASVANVLSPAVMSLLERYRDPAIA